MASDSSSALAASITLMASSAASASALESRVGGALAATARVAAAGRRTSDTSRSRPHGSTRLLDGVARDADAREQRLHARIAACPGAGAMPLPSSPGDHPPRILVEIGVEAGQHDGAMGQARDGRDQFRGGRDRPGRTRGDHRRLGLARKAGGLGLDQRVAARRRFDEAALVAGSPANCFARVSRNFSVSCQY